MTASVKSALTLLTLVGLLLIAAVWGWQAATKPLPSSEPPPLCTDVTVNVGDRVFHDQVAVSVYNGSDRNGTAGATMEQLEERGFVGADSDNAPAKIDGVEIWSDEPRNAAVHPVARQFKGAKVVSGEELGRGIVVVVGESFKALREKEVESVTAVETSTFCSPPESQ
ncbi:LytR C-terminal domain-containing protein [Nocardioides sp. B-3]|uniref:LytR C-terminal domain-containing protein n=1 Tax=Nocardioides sp. B-3 TaxID=2895565 RepID=UPI002152C9C9|nr:LytR C-terminal domain-containing protein [Nocardioides sp. B-3]UUZ60919.1 LytR C-terminal domain-containing protein [Nocardioides sp. B-3]